MSNNKITQNPFLGCFELSLFMKDGLSRFQNDQKALYISFIIPITITFSLLIAAVPYAYTSDLEFQKISLVSLTNLLLAKETMTFAASIGFIYAICRFTDRLEHFKKALIASNWSALIGALLFLPVLFLMIKGTYSYDDLYPTMIVSTIYGYAISAFILKHTLRIPWELSVFMVVCFIAINEGGVDLLKTAINVLA